MLRLPLLALRLFMSHLEAQVTGQRVLLELFVITLHPVNLKVMQVVLGEVLEEAQLVPLLMNILETVVQLRLLYLQTPVQKITHKFI